MNATKRPVGRLGLVFGSVLAIAATGCVHHHTRTVYVPTPPPVVSAPPAPAPEPPPPSPGPIVVIQSESDFYEPLGIYGRWVVVENYGRCWIPARVEVGWRPYSNGYWQRTDAGWYWVSEEPWGWATYHYGRWDFHANFGWIWVPQTQWAPAWVCWREGGGYVGWAPLRPSLSIGVSFGRTEYEPAFASRAFVFVEHRRMLEPVRPKTVIVNNTTIINKTVNITKVNVVNRTEINEGPRPEVVERESGRKVRAVPVHEFRSKEESIVAARERNIPTATSRKVQPPVRAESQPPRPLAAAPPDSEVVAKHLLGEKPGERAAEPAGPSALHARPLPARSETEKRASEEKRHDWTKRDETPSNDGQVRGENRGQGIARGRGFQPAEAKGASPTTAPRDSEAIAKQPLGEKPAQRVAEPTPQSRPLPARSETEKRASEERKHDRPKREETPSSDGQVRSENRGQGGARGRGFQPAEAEAAATKPAPQPVTVNPSLPEIQGHRAADQKGTIARPTGDLENTKPEAKPPVKIDAAPASEKGTERPHVSPKEKSRTAERGPVNKKAKEDNDQKNKGEEQDSTPAPASPQQPR